MPKTKIENLVIIILYRHYKAYIKHISCKNIKNVVIYKGYKYAYSTSNRILYEGDHKVEKHTINGITYKELVINGCANLKLNYKAVDALNVFPVPDGDTGTNMRMTIEAGVNEIKNLDDESIYDIAKKFSRGMLMGARGNSGVILSQLFRGIYKGLTGFTEVNAVELGNAFSSGVAQAYKAVMKPVEGTILTVARESTEAANQKVNENMTIQEFFEVLIAEAKASLERTPDLLPVLKESNVVDSGGAGYIYILEGMLMALKGETVHIGGEVKTNSVGLKYTFNADSVLEYGYCTEFILQLQNSKVNDIANFDPKEIIEFLNSIGDSIVCVRDEDLVKVHVHTKTPGKILNFAQKYGEFLTIKIENMQVQHTELVSVEECSCPECVEKRKQATHKKWAIVMVASGDGLTETFKEMGVDYVVSGGQSMNPAADDFVKGFDELDAENILVFPNNGNIIMAAEQAAKYYNKTNVYVIPTKSIAQGYSALAMLDTSSDDIEVIRQETKEVIDNVTTGLVTYSIRDAEIDDLQIKARDFMGLCNGKIVSSEKEKLTAIEKLLATANTDEKELVTIIYGHDVTEEELNQVLELIQTNYPNVEIEQINGGQEIYSYILSIE